MTAQLEITSDTAQMIRNRGGQAVDDMQEGDDHVPDQQHRPAAGQWVPVHPAAIEARNALLLAAGSG